MAALTSRALAVDAGNYAGRPNTATYDGSCHWTIYGKVNNRMVLFGPYHCFGSPTGQKPSGSDIYGQFGSFESRLGFVAVPTADAIAADMGWMWLDNGSWLTIRNAIGRSGAYFLNTAKYPNSNLTCSNLLNGFHYEEVTYWTETNGYEGPFTGLAHGGEDHGSGNCLVATELPFESGSRHVPSGAPWIDPEYGGSGFLGDTTDTSDGFMRFNSWRQAIIDLNTYELSHGVGAGAWFCSNASCT
jgi:hypothetical protein